MRDGELVSMKKHLNLALALMLGIPGGVLSRYIAPPSAFAQNPPPPATALPQQVPNDRPAVTKEVRAESFTLVDATSRTVATFMLSPQTQPPSQQDAAGRRIVLRDPRGRELWSAGGSPFRLPSER